MVRPLASSTPTVRLRLSGLVHVAIRSPNPVRPGNVRGSPPIATPSRVISARPRVSTIALVLSPSPNPSAMPAAMATTFFSAPPNSQPVTSGLVYTRNRRLEKTRCSDMATCASGIAMTAAAA